VVRRAQLLRDGESRGASPVARALGPGSWGLDQRQSVFPGKLFFLPAGLVRGRCPAYVGAAPACECPWTALTAPVLPIERNPPLIRLIWYPRRGLTGASGCLWGVLGHWLPFSLLGLWSSNPTSSYTLRVLFGGDVAFWRSSAGKYFPQNSFVWARGGVGPDFDSRPYKKCAHFAHFCGTPSRVAHDLSAQPGDPASRPASQPAQGRAPEGDGPRPPSRIDLPGSQPLQGKPDLTYPAPAPTLHLPPTARHRTSPDGPKTSAPRARSGLCPEPVPEPGEGP
jgi:hypothetical protein